MIATYLASKTQSPKARLMEYIGLGSFLTAMAVYPKFAINGPAKIIHGYDIDKEYIDDQGRKKSVMQDSNYVPYDMYLGNVPEEDISKIGDKMGIPKDIVNRDAVIKEQMRKIATQNNTLWMLTACVTPALSGLMCYGIENYIVEPLVEKSKLSNIETKITKLLNETSTMYENFDVNNLKSNQLSKRVEELLSVYKGQELPQQEYKNILELLTDEGLFANTADGIEKDITKIFETSAAKGNKSVIISKDTANTLRTIAQNNISKHQKDELEKILVPTLEEIETVLKKYLPENANLEAGASTNIDNVLFIKKDLAEIINARIQSTPDIPKQFLELKRTKILDNITEELKTKKSYFVSEESIKQITDFAKILGEYKENQKRLQAISHTLLEDRKGTILANAYGKFEKTLLDVLGIKYKDLKKMGESEAFTKDILDKKLSEICTNEARYEKAIEKLGNVISELEVKLNGQYEDKSRLLDLITAIEQNYNNTAKRLSDIGSFQETVNKLVKEDVNTLGNSLHSRENLFDYLDGIIESEYKTFGDWGNLSEEARTEYLKKNSKGVGSSKNLEISRLLERYQGAKNSLHRIIHSFDIYKRANDPKTFVRDDKIAKNGAEYANHLIEMIKEMLLTATSSDHTLKLNTVNNPTIYKDVMNTAFSSLGDDIYSTKQKSYLDEVTTRALEKNNSSAHGNVLDRIQYYLTRFKNIIANNTDDFTKPDHIINPYVRKSYTNEAKTPIAEFNLIGQTPVDMVQNAAKKRYSTQKWFRKVATIAGSLTGVAIVAQFFFGKLSNPQNLKKQENYNANK